MTFKMINVPWYSESCLWPIQRKADPVSFSSAKLIFVFKLRAKKKVKVF